MHEETVQYMYGGGRVGCRILQSFELEFRVRGHELIHSYISASSYVSVVSIPRLPSTGPLHGA